MPVNLNQRDRWEADVAASVAMYNRWFTEFAPGAFKEARLKAVQEVEITLRETQNLTNITPEILRAHPEILPTLRMSTCPPLAVDRLIGLSGVGAGLVKSIELHKRMPPRMAEDDLLAALEKIGTTIEQLADKDVFVWLGRETPPSKDEIYRASVIIADRLCTSFANPIIRNAQEKRQLANLKTWLEAHGYQQAQEGTRFDTLAPGTFTFRSNVPVRLEGGEMINIPIDAVIMPLEATPGSMPLFFEAKSAGDFTNTNKRRKEEATKMVQLRNTYGQVSFNLFLCGYFDAGYLSYEAAEGIDWVWEHRIDDLALFGI